MSVSGRRILLTADAVGGVWTYTLDLAEGLAAAGAMLRLVALGPALRPEQRDDLARRGLDAIETGHALEWLAADEDELRASAAAVAAEARNWGADLVHLHTPALAVAAYPCPVVAVHHGCVATWWVAVRGTLLPEDFIWRAALIGSGLRRADVVLAPTAAHAADVAAVYGVAQAPGVVHNGRADVAAADDEPQCDEIFTAGRLWDEGKNIAALDRAAARLPWPVVAAGDAAGSNGTAVSLRTIAVLGRLSDADMRTRLSRRPIFAAPARFEPFGLAVLEAAQAGCALVLNELASFRELWDGAALFADANDPDALAAALRTLVDDRDARRRIGRAAQLRAGSYTRDAMVAGTLAAYNRCFDRQRAFSA